MIVPSVVLSTFFSHSYRFKVCSPLFPFPYIDPYLLPSPHLVLCKQMQLPWRSNEPLSGRHGCYRSEFTFLLAESHTKIGGRRRGKGDGVSEPNYSLISILNNMVSRRHALIRRLSASPTPCLHTLSFSHIHFHTHTHSHQMTHV